jgi:AcrR family transcriptional regulator
VTTQSPRQRRSQAQRSAETRTRVLDATIDCLVKYGYARTTTARVAEMAGVTRGAQVHHFGSRDELMMAAVEHLAVKRFAAAIPQFTGTLATAQDPLGEMLELAWDIHSPPIFVPICELWVAGRTDPALGREVAKFEAMAVGGVLTVAGFVPEEIQPSMLEFMYSAMDALRGILVSSFVDTDPTRARRRWERAIINLRRGVDPAVIAWIAARG